MTLEQLHAELILKAANLHAEDRLRHARLLCGLTERPLLIDPHEIADLLDFHSPPHLCCTAGISIVNMTFQFCLRSDDLSSPLVCIDLPHNGAAASAKK
ncbi:MAG: hypothetical protein WBB98_18985 [Xanthobacteraceae bacterium]